MSTSVDNSLPSLHDFEKSILGIIQTVKSEKQGQQVKEYKLTAKRIRAINNRKTEFHKLWGNDRDFTKACKYAFSYKAKEWHGTDMWRYFEPETLLSDKFSSYLEKAEQDKGEPQVVKSNEPEKVVYTRSK